MPTLVSTASYTITDYHDKAPRFAFIRSASQPTTPTGAAPAGWTIGSIPSGTLPIWSSVGYFNSTGELTDPWSTPQVTSVPGTSGTRPNPDIPAGLWLFDDVPALPDNPIDTLWNPSMATVPTLTLFRSTVASYGSYLRTTATAADAYWEFTLPSSCHGKVVVVKMRRVSGAWASADSAFGYVANPGYSHAHSLESLAPGAIARVNAAPIGAWVYLVFRVPTTYTDLTVFRLGDVWQDATYVWDLGGVYIGDGSYASKKTTYRQGAFATADGWGGVAGNQTVSVSGGRLKATSIAAGNVIIDKTLTVAAGQWVRLRVKSPFLIAVEIPTVEYLASSISCTTEKILWYRASTGGASLRLWGTATGTGQVLEVDWLDISDGLFGPSDDVSDFDNQLVLQPGCVRVDGPAGAAIDTTLGGAKGADNFLPMGATPRAIFVWFNSPTPGSAYGRMFHYGQSATNKLISLLHVGTTYNLETFGSVVSIPDSGTFSGWHLLAFDFDGANVQPYLDGRPIGSPVAATLATLAGSELWIGSGFASADPYQGRVAMPRIYPRSLSADEHLWAYSNPGILPSQAVDQAIGTRTPRKLDSGTSDPQIANLGDWYYNSATHKIRTLKISGWEDTTDTAMFMACAQDIMLLESAGLGGMTQAVQFIQSLVGKDAFFDQLAASIIRATGLTLDGSNNVTAGMEIDLVNSRIRSPQFRARGKAGDGDPLSLGPISAPTLRAKEDGTLGVTGDFTCKDLRFPDFTAGSNIISRHGSLAVANWVCRINTTSPGSWMRRITLGSVGETVDQAIGCCFRSPANGVVRVSYDLAATAGPLGVDQSARFSKLSASGSTVTSYSAITLPKTSLIIPDHVTGYQDISVSRDEVVFIEANGTTSAVQVSIYSVTYGMAESVPGVFGHISRTAW